MRIINTQKIIDELKLNLKKEVALMNKKPTLAILQVEGAYQSDIYVRNKIKLADQLGIETKHIMFPKDVEQEEVRQVIILLNRNFDVDGIIVQLPLPDHLNEREILETIAVKKDVDGLTTGQMSLLEINDEKALVPCTASGVLKLIQSQCNIEGKDVVIVNRSHLIGKPLQKVLTNMNATVTLCHSKTKNLDKKTRDADIVITGVGIANKFNAKNFTSWQIIIDCSMNMHDGKLCGDVNVEDLKNLDVSVASGKGHTGPCTVLSLMENTIKACKNNEQTFN